MDKRERGFSTRSVQGNKVLRSGPAVEPIVQASTFVFENQKVMLDSVTGKSGLDVYTRWTNPTTRNAEEKIDSLEGTEKTQALSSGMAAISSSIFGLAKGGDRIISTDSIYGGTLHLFEDILPNGGINVDFVGLEEFPDAIADSEGKYKIAYFETPTNPTLGIVDIQGVADASRATDTLSIIDNTFATPINQRPYKMGIDIVIHSATKYLGGHTDIVAGTVSGTKEKLGKIISASRLLGGTLDPFAAFLLDRGIKTLAVRMERHNSNAEYLAKIFSGDSRIRRVHFPGLPSHPSYEVAKGQMDGYGGMLAIEIDCDLEATENFVDSLELFLNAVSLGGVESLASIPALTTHYGIDKEVLAEMNISDSTVRLSVGIEDPEDLRADIESALEKVC
ncbi:MAG: trans-sulfuration enzyme family protein [Candidatus Thorarchaeota archaeon]|jgi:cystathionine beta-lyase/cystathionine gamma-synthase